MVSFETVRERYANEVEALISEFLLNSQSATGRAIAQMSQYHLETGGKRIRALIPSYIYEVMGHDGRIILPFGAAVEMVHNATLVHDDLQDGDEMRRGRPTVWKKYSSAQAVNCGDAMFQYAFQLMRKLEIEPQLILRLIDRAADATLKVIEGQAQEFIMKEENFPGVERYLGVIRGKTSGLFALPVVGALEASHVSGTLCNSVEVAAQELGVLFQIQDDYLDLYGEKGRDRKATDVAEGKVSFFVAYTNEKGTEKQRIRLQDILRKPRDQTTNQEIKEALAVFDQVGAKNAALKFMDDIRSSLHQDKTLRSELPGVHQALVTLCDQFLKPIEDR